MSHVRECVCALCTCVPRFMYVHMSVESVCVCVSHVHGSVLANVRAGSVCVCLAAAGRKSPQRGYFNGRWTKHIAWSNGGSMRIARGNKFCC